MAQDPLSHAASRLTLKSSEERPPTAEELATIEFEAVDEKDCHVLYNGMTTQETIMFRLASGFLAKSKPDLVSTVRKWLSEENGGDQLFEFMDGLSAAEKRVESFAKCLGAAHRRLLVASAVIAFEPDNGRAAC